MKKLPIFIFTVWLFSVNVSAQEAELVDMFDDLTCNDVLARLDNFVIRLQDSQNSLGYVVSYEGKYTKNILDKNYNLIKKVSVLPQLGQSVERTYTMMKQIDYRGYPRDKLVFVNGGFREKYEVQFWIFPKGADLPKTEPTLEKMKYRKGKPIDICEWLW